MHTPELVRHHFAHSVAGQPSVDGGGMRLED